MNEEKTERGTRRAVASLIRHLVEDHGEDVEPIDPRIDLAELREGHVELHREEAQDEDADA